MGDQFMRNRPQPLDSNASRSKEADLDVASGSLELRASEPRTLALELRSAIETQIVDGKLAPGQKLDEAVLAAHFEVSRTPVREALRALAAVGLVEFRPRVGAIVAKPTVSEVMDLFELVAELEGAAARLACERMEPADETVIFEALESCRAAAGSFDPGDYYAVNGRFHRAIHAAAHNEALSREITLLDKRLSPYRRFITFRPGRTETALREHDRVAEALAERDGDRAAAAMREHVRILRDDAFTLARSLRF
jgi:DNA-binding GntR family transcriptional regulator